MHEVKVLAELTLIAFSPIFFIYFLCAVLGVPFHFDE